MVHYVNRLSYIPIRVQAENKNFSPPTFLKWFDPRIDLTPFFRPPEFFFAYLIGLLGRPPWSPLAIPPCRLVCLTHQK